MNKEWSSNFRSFATVHPVCTCCNKRLQPATQNAKKPPKNKKKKHKKTQKTWINVWYIFWKKNLIKNWWITSSFIFLFPSYYPNFHWKSVKLKFVSPNWKCREWYIKQKKPFNNTFIVIGGRNGDDCPWKAAYCALRGDHCTVAHLDVYTRLDSGKFWLCQWNMYS